MKDQDEIAKINRKHWNKMVDSGCDFTLPWMDLDRKKICRFLEGDTKNSPDYLRQLFPLEIFADIKDKEVLCLAAGGGQQSVVFSLLGANVTVVDLSERQLDMDRKAAKYYGYQVELIHSNMQNLSDLKENTFDLVYGTGMCYIEDVKQVYLEVNRVLKLRGIYRVDFSNPATEFVDSVDWNGEGYIISRPYKERIRRTQNGPIEFRHTLKDIFNGLINSGFTIKRVEEMPHFMIESRDPPGSWTHWQKYITRFVILAQKQVKNI